MAAELPSCFKAYDIRGKVPEELNGPLAKAVGKALARQQNLKKVVIGRDIRPSGMELAAELADGLLEGGCDVLDIGVCGTEEIYHAVFSGHERGIDGGIIITASHNPAQYNGMKIVLSGAKPLSKDNGLEEIGRMAANGLPAESIEEMGNYSFEDFRAQYIDHVMECIDTKNLPPFTIVVNGGNGCAGEVIDLLEKRLPFHFIKINHEPDGTFPNGVPNPLLPENRDATSQAVVANGADLGIAWDGDFDRCFFWDECGNFIEGYYIVGLLARELLEKHPGEKILHDPRLIWNTVDIVKKSGGVPVMTRTGHAFIKERMRQENGLYGGEMSAHHYFRDFGYCDSGMIPWLLVASLMGREDRPLSSLVSAMIANYPISGEINSIVDNSDDVLKRIADHFADADQDVTDGLSVTMDEVRFNVRASNTEELLRLNVESRGDSRLVAEMTEKLLQLINQQP